MPRKTTAIVSPNLGLYLDRPVIDVPSRALIDGYNFRIKEGRLSNLNLGWERFSLDWTLNGPVTFIDNFFPRGQAEHLLFGTLTDIYRYDGASDSVVFLTPRYATGSAAASGTAVTGSGGTLWLANAKAGDEIHFGNAAQTDPTATWFTIATVNSDTSITLTASAGTIGAGAYTIRQKFTGDLQDQWSIDTFTQDAVSGNDQWVATNGIQFPVSWDGIATQVTVHSELGFTCKALATYSNMMIYGNILDSGVEFPSSIINSDVGKPFVAGDAGAGISEQFRVHDGTDGIENLVTLGDYLTVYSERHVIPIQFVGAPLIFLFRRAVVGIGPVAHNAIVDFGDYHEFVGSDAQYVFDGVSVRETNSQVWREIIRQTDPIRRPQIFAHFDEENGDIIWSVPSTTDPGAGTAGNAPVTGWSEHYLEDVPPDVNAPFSKRAFPFTASGYYERAEGLTWENALGNWDEYNYAWNDQFFTLGFPQNIVGDITGKIFILNETQTGDGALLPSYIRFPRMALGDGRDRGLLRRVYPFSDKLDNELTISMYAADNAVAAAVLLASFAFDTTLSEGGHFQSVFRRARYIELQFGTPGHAWRLSGYDYDITDGGRR